MLMDSARLADDPAIRPLLPAVVSVKADNRLGTGFNIRADGLIVTCRHIVEGAGSVEITFESGQTEIVDQWTEFKDADLALIDVDLSGLPYVDFDELVEPQEMDPIFLIGNPEGFVRIIGEGYAVGLYSLAWSVSPVLLIQAPVFKGNSGSPVFNSSGQLLGMVFAASDTASEDGVIGFAVPASEIASRVDMVLAEP